MGKHAIFLGGPIGSGKTTLGRALAGAIDGAFIDGDDHADPARPWYGSSLRTSRAVVRLGLEALRTRPAVVVAYPLRCTNWIYYRRKFGDAGAQPLFISLRASVEAIASARRGRRFSDAEQARIKVMVEEGYGARPFSDLIVETDAAAFETTARTLIAGVRRLTADG